MKTKKLLDEPQYTETKTPANFDEEVEEVRVRVRGSWRDDELEEEE